MEVSKALIKHLGTDIIPAEITEKTKMSSVRGDIAIYGGIRYNANGALPIKWQGKS